MEDRMNKELKGEIPSNNKEEIEKRTDGIPEIPPEIARRFEKDKDIQYEKLIQRLKDENVW